MLVGQSISQPQQGLTFVYTQRNSGFIQYNMSLLYKDLQKNVQIKESKGRPPAPILMPTGKLSLHRTSAALVTDILRSSYRHVMRVHVSCSFQVIDVQRLRQVTDKTTTYLLPASAEPGSSVCSWPSARITLPPSSCWQNGVPDIHGSACMSSNVARCLGFT